MIANMRYKLVLSVGYLLVLVWLAHNTDWVPPDWLAYAFMFGVPFVLGLTAGLWPTLALPAAGVLAIPAGYGGGGKPVWFGTAGFGGIAFPADGITKPRAPSVRARVIAMPSPRALKEPVGLSPSSLAHT